MVNSNNRANKVLVLAVVILLTCLIAAVVYAALANNGYINSRTRLDEAKQLYDAAIADMTKKTDDAAAVYANADTRYAEAKSGAQEAEAEYQNCLAALDEAATKYEQARLALESTQSSSAESAADYALARTALADARDAVTASQNALSAAQNELTAAKAAYNNAQTEYEKANGALELAISKYDLAVADYQAAIDLINSFVESGGNDAGLPSANEIYSASINSIVEIRAYDIYDTYFKLGSGFFITADGKVVTNYHVIQNAFRLEVFHNDGNFYEVTSILGYDADIDLAVIKIDKNDCAPLALSEEKPEVGDTVYAIGSNMGLTRTFTKGIISYVDRDIEGFEENSYIHYVGITHSGNSGCPMLDANGKVIGVHQLGDSQTGDNGLAIPIAQLSAFAHDKDETPHQTAINNAADISDKLLYTTGFNGKLTITGVSSLIEDSFIRIPSQIGGSEVEYINWGNNSANLYYVEHIVVSEGIKRIGDNAFSSAYYLLSVTLPSTLTELSQTAFSEATEIYKIFMDGGTNFSLTDGVLYNAAGTVLYKYPLCKSDENNPAYTESYAVPSGVATICDFAIFYALGLSELVLPQSLRSIGTMSISYCLNLTGVNLPEGLDYIGAGALSTDIKLASLALPASVTVLGERLNDGSGYIYKGPFFQCESLTSATIASGSRLAAMGDSVFGYCLNLVSVSGFPSSLASVGDAAFLNCTSLKSIDLSATALQDIGVSAFRNCSALETAALPSSLTSIVDKSFYACSGLNSLNIPSTVTSIGIDAFFGAAALQSITLPAGLAEIGEGAFYDCVSLASVNLQATAITVLGAYSFCGAGLTSIALPQSLEVVGEYAFAACAELRTLSLSAGTLWLKTGAFLECGKLAEIDATACEYPPHLSDADVFLGTSDALIITVATACRQYFINNSAWMVYRAHLNFI